MKKNFENMKKIIGGFMAIEILVAASIIAVSILAATMVAQKSVYVSRQALHVTQAAFLLEEGAEAVRILRDNAWADISNLSLNTNYYLKFSGGTWITTQVPEDGLIGIFTRNISVASVMRDNTTKDIVSSGGTLDSNTKLITVSVAWSEGGATITKTLQFYVINIFP